MRFVAILLAGAMFTCAASAVEPSSTTMRERYLDVREACLGVVYQPACRLFSHECPTPVTPCTSSFCPPTTCHKPLMTCTPTLDVCLEGVCHKPVVTLTPEICCTCDVQLTGRLERESGTCEDCS